MSYSSIPFLYFLLPLTLLFHSIVPFRWRNTVLFISSLVFFAWEAPLLPLFLLVGILFNFLIGILLDRLSTEGNRKLILIVGVTVSLIPVLIQPLRTNTPPYLTAAAALYSLHAISYLTEIYRRKVHAPTSFTALAIYLSMFPHTLAGPIAHYDDIYPVLMRRPADINRTADGIWRFVIGMSKKVLLADRLFSLCEQASSFSAPGAAAVWLQTGSFCAAFWMAFSGYCDMAVGLGKMFGFDLPENFDHPFSAHSLQEFSRRWNLTLSAWMREYFLQPFFGHKPHLPAAAVILCSFLAAFFYGGRLNVLLWSCSFGLLTIGERFLWGRFLEKLPRLLRRFITLFEVAIVSVFLVSGSVIGALRNFAALFGVNGLGLGQAAYLFGSCWPILLFCALCAARRPGLLLSRFSEAHPQIVKWLRPAAMLILLVCCTAYLI